MSFILYVVVLVVSLSSVMMGLDWLSTPPPPIPPSAQVASAPAKATAPTAKTAASGTASSKTAGDRTTDNEATGPKTTESKTAAPAPVATTGQASHTAAAPVPANDGAATQPDTAGNRDNGASDNTLNVMANDTDAGGTDAQANATPRCDVQACAAHYRSFDPTDCTYQPYEGPRRLCTIGNPPQQASDKPAGMETSDASQPAAPSSCNVQACAAAYQSFDPATCTWQPYVGPRRPCTK